MQIDWFTIVAQLVNFLILVGLLKRFLYRPVVDAMDRREHRIAEQLREAEASKQEADARAREFQQKSADLERRRADMLQQARSDAEAERRKSLQEASKDLDEQRQRGRAQLDQEWQEVRRSLAGRLAGTVTEAARRALEDLSDTTLEEAIARAFQRRLSTLADDDRQAIAQGGAPLELATAFEPSDETRRLLTAAVRDSLGRDVRFVRAKALVGGLELRGNGSKVSWSMAEYLRDLEDRVMDSVASAPAQAVHDSPPSHAEH